MNHAEPRPIRARRTISGIMIAIAASAGVFALVRPVEERTAIRLAAEIIQRYDDPNFQADRYRVVAIATSQDGSFLTVRFKKASGPGRDDVWATVPLSRVRRLSSRWW